MNHDCAPCTPEASPSHPRRASLKAAAAMAALLLVLAAAASTALASEAAAPPPGAQAGGAEAAAGGESALPTYSYGRALLILGLFGVSLAVMLVVSERFLVPKGSVVVDLGDSKVRVPIGTNLMSGLADHGIFVPSACGGKGTCHYCKVDCKSGADPMSALEEQAISKKDRRKGTRLSCQVKVKRDMVVSLPNTGMKRFTAECTKFVQVSPFIAEITFKLIDPPRMDFRAGHYMQFEIPVDEAIKSMRGSYAGFDFAKWDEATLADDLKDKSKKFLRAYSMSNSPGNDTVAEFNIRIAPPPKGSNFPPGAASCYTWSRKPGDRVTLVGPAGDFEIKETDREMVFIGGGAGMAPMKAMILELFEVHKTKRLVKFYYGARARRDLFYVDIFENIAKQFPNFQYIPALSEPLPGDNWTGPVGFIHKVVEQHLPQEWWELAEWYLCGPPMMIDAVEKMLYGRGIKKEDVAFDKF